MMNMTERKDPRVTQMAAELKDRKVTVITTNEFFGNMNVFEGRLVDFGTRPYAQYSNAPYVKFIPTRKRKPVCIMKTYNPTLIVIDGVGHNLTPNDEVVLSETSEVRVTTLKYSSFDPRYVTEFLAKLKEKNIEPLFYVAPNPEFA